MNLTMPWTASRKTPVNGVTSKLDEIRNALSNEADRLAEVAAQFGREASGTVAKIAEESVSSASKLSHDAVSQAAKIGADAGDKASSAVKDPVGTTTSLGQSLVRGIADVGAALASSGKQTAKDLSKDANTVARDLRKVRITTDAKQSKPDALPGITLLAGFGTGIALMYFFDPERGKRRRAMLREQLTKWTRMGRDTVQGKARDLQNRAAGARSAAAGLTHDGQDSEDVQDMFAETGFGSDPVITDSRAGQPFGQENGSTDYGSTDYGTPSEVTTESWEEQQTEESRSSRIEIG
ncbi:MAG TPA: hypothetical protein VMZ33_00380 [Candidatus Limnocylindrales bacterium]|nr:hypothetical protein [Candidatus Limnocylindrales bacterium]